MKIQQASSTLKFSIHMFSKLCSISRHELLEYQAMYILCTRCIGYSIIVLNLYEYEENDAAASKIIHT